MQCEQKKSHQQTVKVKSIYYRAKLKTRVEPDALQTLTITVNTQTVMKRNIN